MKTYQVKDIDYTFDKFEITLLTFWGEYVNSEKELLEKYGDYYVYSIYDFWDNQRTSLIIDKKPPKQNIIIHDERYLKQMPEAVVEKKSHINGVY